MAQSGRFETIGIAERWSADLFRFVQRPGFFVSCDIDMRRSCEIIDAARERHVRLTFGNLVVRAVGLALHRMADSHCMMESSRRYVPATVDAAVPVGGSGNRFLPASMLLRDIGRSRLPDIAAAMEKEIAALRSAETADFTALRRAALLLNRRWIRALLVRRFLKSAAWRHEHMGTVHISLLKDVDFFVPLTPFVGIGIGAGRVRERPIVEDGEVRVRPIMTISCCGDHAVWDGLTASHFMNEVQNILAEGELRSELELPAGTRSAVAAM